MLKWIYQNKCRSLWRFILVIQWLTRGCHTWTCRMPASSAISKAIETKTICLCKMLPWRTHRRRRNKRWRPSLKTTGLRFNGSNSQTKALSQKPNPTPPKCRSAILIMPFHWALWSNIWHASAILVSCNLAHCICWKPHSQQLKSTLRTIHSHSSLVNDIAFGHHVGYLVNSWFSKFVDKGQSSPYISGSAVLSNTWWVFHGIIAVPTKKCWLRTNSQNCSISKIPYQQLIKACALYHDKRKVESRTPVMQLLLDSISWL